MSLAAKNSYPRAIPSQSPEELVLQLSRLKQANEQLTAEARRLQEHNDALAERARRLRRWTVRSAGFSFCLVLLVAGAVTLLIQFPGILTLGVAASPSDAEVPQVKEATPPTPIALVKTNASPDPIRANKATLVLPAQALAKPSAVQPEAPSQKAGFLEALGGLSAAHLYQSHLNIGLIADGVESETYTVEEADKNLKAVLDLMKMVDSQLVKVAKAGIDKEDQDSIRDMQAIAALLHLQTAALRGYWADGDLDQAANYHKARKASWQGLSKVMGLE